ncbi:MAG: chromate transporter [Oscillospiraceae bacterium]|jgi:chromate transporter|nr:chromate transporter [Oscillospiraceae bacterium]
MTYIHLILEFLKTGLLAIGGGLATLPFLREISSKYGWFTEQELVDMLAISESTPGPLGVNMATYAGWNAAGIPGGTVATLSLVLPSVITVLIIARFLKRYGENKIVTGAFWALRPAATGLIGGALFVLLIVTLSGTEAANLPSVSLYALLTAACFAGEYIPGIKKLRIHPLFFIAAGAIFGIVLNLAQ